MVYSVAIIGCGNLGSRHLQALKLSSKNLNLTVCESDDTARAIAQERYDQIKGSRSIKSIEYLSDYKKIHDRQDVIIIATSAGPRYDIATWIVKNVKVKYMILEKVVFQEIDQLNQFEKLIHEKKIKVWINCPRRMFSYYKKLKDKLCSVDKVDMKINGMNWGMACNSIHILDLYQYFTCCKNFLFNNDFLIQNAYDSKRKGYKEFFGEFFIETERGKISFACKNGNEMYSFIEIETELIKIMLFESSMKAIVVNKKTGETYEETIDIQFQSNLTNIAVEQLLDKGDCELTKYEESAVLHKVILQCFLNHINKTSEMEEQRCPIT